MKRLLLGLVLCGTLLLPAGAMAATPTPYDPLGQACSSGGNTSAVCNKGHGATVTDPNAVMRRVTNIIAVLAGFIAIIIIIVGGIMFLTSGGDTQKVAGARSAVLGALIGLAIIALARAVVLFILSKL